MRFLSNLGAVLKAVFIAIGKVLYLLLLKLYLIIPALYVLAIWIASLCVPFRMGNYGTLIVVGTVLCTALSILLILRRYMLGAKKPEQQTVTNVTAATVSTAAAAPAQTPEQPAQAAPVQAEAPAPEQQVQQAPQQVQQAPQPVQQPAAPAPQAYGNPYGTDPYSAYSDAPAQPVRQPAQRVPTEDAPICYRSRSDPSIVIEEYPDRFDYYRKLSDGQYLYFLTQKKRGA